MAVLQRRWRCCRTSGLLSEKAREQLDQAQLAFVIQVCRESATLSDAGRKFFAATWENRKTANDADRLRKYLARFDFDWQNVRQAATAGQSS